MTDSTVTGPLLFVDSSAIIALVDRTDSTHDAAVDAYRSLAAEGYRLFTTNHVIAETVSLLNDGVGPEIARQFLRSHRLSVYHADETDEQRARVMVAASRTPSGLSLVDAISLVVMERLGVSDVFAVDPNLLAETNEG